MNGKFEVLDNDISFDYSLLSGEDSESRASLFETARKVNKAIDFINHQIVNREEIVRQSFYALLTGEHQLLLGRTGMAKSLLARQIFACFENVSVFEKQLTKDTMPDNLFGAYDIDEMKRGKMFHNIEGSIVLSDFAFLDEIFDANDMLLRSLLSLLNERRLVNGAQQIRSSLRSVIGATNYLRATEMLDAVLDRFLYKSYINENKNLYTQLAIDRVYREQNGTVKSPEQKIVFDDFMVLQRLIKGQTIEIPEYILFLKNYVLRKYIEETRVADPNQANFTISDRTSVKIQDLLRASAVLDLRLQVEEKDLEQMTYLVCIVGKREDHDRLVNIIRNAQKYFGSDQHLLKEAFQMSRIMREMKINKDSERLFESPEIHQTMDEIENNLKDKKGLRQRFINITNRFIHFSPKSEVAKVINLIGQYCELLRQMAAKKETLEIIEGLEQELESFQPQAFLN